ncbi:MAG: nucleotide sugar dehydrogenase [Rhodospirillales bacterium]|jgi:GDP-mannose 6-dehydrogenase|nr:nucleotide sugar dehydrogenase [Rhodospirillales bacterium]
MRVSVFGLGYVGSVSAACLARSGHTVVGVEPNPVKVDLINDGRPPVIEAGLDALVQDAVAAGRLRATADAAEAVRSSDVSLVCVGTPSQRNGSLDLAYVRRACEQIGGALRDHPDFHVVCVRSTILPGSMRGVVIPTLEAASGRRCGVDFGVANNPEFLREGTAVNDYAHPPKTVIGASDARSGALVAQLYDGIDAPLIVTEIEIGEMVKYADNAWHAVKVAFANEIGNISKELGIDSHKVMDIFCQDTKLNLSPYYMKPGFAFGGSCLPKDVRALTYAAQQLDVRVPLLASVLDSNELQIRRGLEMIYATNCRRIGILGFSFKAGTDDLRESPLVVVIETLIGKGFDLRLYDRNVRLSALTGANREFIETRIPHISRLMVDRIEHVLDHAEVVVVGNGAPEFRNVFAQLRAEQTMIDFVRVTDGSAGPGRYVGICW